MDDLQTTLTGEPTEPWRDPELLRTLWDDGDGSITEMADELGCSRHTVYRALDEHGIREIERENNPPAFHTRTDGYEMVMDDNKGILIHRLVAIAEFGYDAVDGAEAIHHKNTHKWDNRPSNLQIFQSHAAHQREHKRPKADDDQAGIDEWPGGDRDDRDVVQLDVDDDQDAQTTLHDFA